MTSTVLSLESWSKVRGDFDCPQRSKVRQSVSGDFNIDCPKRSKVSGDFDHCPKSKVSGVFDCPQKSKVSTTGDLDCP